MTVIKAANSIGLRRTWRNAGIPTNGTSGTLATVADAGDLLIDVNNKTLYQNTGTKASPTWTEKAASGASLSVDVANMAASGTAAANVLGGSALAAPINHIHKIGTHDHSDNTKGGATLGDITAKYVILANTTVPANTFSYIARDNAGDITVHAITGKTVNLAVVGVDVVTIAATAITLRQAVTITAGGLTIDAGGATITGNSTITGDLNVTGSLTFGGNWTVAATLTVDELILDTDGDAGNIGATDVAFWQDNAGDGTINVKTGKVLNIAVAKTDEYSFSSTAITMNSNHISGAGYLDLAAVTISHGDNVRIGHDNAGDLTLNARNNKAVNLSINGSDEYTFNATVAAFGANNLTFSTGEISYSGAGGIDLAASGYLKVGATPANAGGIRLTNNAYITVRNNADGADINLVKVNAADLVEFGASLAATTLGGTLTLGSQTVSLSTGNITFSGAGYVSIGANPSGTGYIRLSNDVWIAARNQANGADINMIRVNAIDDVELGADLQMAAGVIYGDSASGGNLILHSTIHGTKGFVGIPDTHEGLKVGGTAVRATPSTNAVDLYDGTAPVGALANGVTLYSTGGEFYAMDATGNSALNSPHSDDGDYIIFSYSVKKNRTVAIHLEKLCNALADKFPSEFGDFVEGMSGLKHKNADKVKLNW